MVKHADDILPPGNSYATMDSVEWGDKDLHVKGTLRKGTSLSFHLFNPETIKAVKLVRCGICKDDMTGFKSCPYCYPERVEVTNGRV